MRSCSGGGIPSVGGRGGYLIEKKITEMGLEDTLMGRHGLNEEKGLSRGIIAASCVGVLILLGGGIWASVGWPSQWNAMLGSFLVSLMATLVGVLVAVLIAIFVVDRYNERRRKQEELMATIEKRRYRISWEAYFHGGTSTLSALVCHLALFVVYGRNRYLEILEAEEDTTEVPDTIRAYTPWLLENFRVSRHEPTDSSLGGLSKGRGMNPERLLGVFKTESGLGQVCTAEDLAVLLHYLRLFRVFLQDQVFLFQPFMATRMGFATALVQLSRSLNFAISDVERCLSSRVQLGKEDRVPGLGKVMNDNFATLGIHAATVAKMTGSADEDATDLVQLLGKNGVRVEG